MILNANFNETFCLVLSVLRDHIAGAVWKFMSSLCLSILVFSLLCCPYLLLSSVLSFVPFVLYVGVLFNY